MPLFSLRLLGCWEAGVGITIAITAPPTARSVAVPAPISSMTPAAGE